MSWGSEHGTNPARCDSLGHRARQGRDAARQDEHERAHNKSVTLARLGLMSITPFLRKCTGLRTGMGFASAQAHPSVRFAFWETASPQANAPGAATVSQEA